MLTSLTRVVLSVSALMTLANCDKLDRIENVQEFAGVAIDAGQTRTRVLGDPITGIDPLPGTSFDAVPTSGEATFKGAAYVAATSSSDRTVGFALVGRSEVTVDFGANSNNLTGTMSDFQTANVANGIADVSGTLRLSNGVVGAERPNSFTVDYGGDLTVDGDDFALSGDMSGRFRGTRTNPSAGQSPVRALSALDEDGLVTDGLETLTGRVVLIAEN